jgi:hypothetical protein
MVAVVAQAAAAATERRIAGGEVRALAIFLRAGHDGFVGRLLEAHAGIFIGA